MGSLVGPLVAFEVSLSPARGTMPPGPGAAVNPRGQHQPLAWRSVALESRSACVQACVRRCLAL